MINRFHQKAALFLSLKSNGISIGIVSFFQFAPSFEFSDCLPSLKKEGCLQGYRLDFVFSTAANNYFSAWYLKECLDCQKHLIAYVCWFDPLVYQ